MILCFDKQGNKYHWILTSCMYTTNRNEQLVNVSYNSLDNFEEISSHDETKLKLLESDFSLTNSKA